MALRARCQQHKWAHSRGLTRLNRYVSIYITAAIVRTRITANTVTLWSIAAGLGGAVLFLHEDRGIRLMGAALLYASFLLDQVDGEVARYWNATTLAGSFLDEVRHLLIYATPVFAVALRLVMDGASPLIAGAGFMSALSLSLLRFSRNARFLLVMKKLLAEANGAVRTPTRGQIERTANATTIGGMRGTIRRALAVVTYGLTNQVSLLLLLFAFQFLSGTLEVVERAVVYTAYSAALVALTCLDLWTMTRTRLERSCVELLRELNHQHPGADTPAAELARNHA